MWRWQISLHHLDHLDLPLQHDITQSPFHWSRNTQHQSKSSMPIYWAHGFQANYVAFPVFTYISCFIRWNTLSKNHPNSTLQGTLQTISCPHHSIDLQGFVPNLKLASTTTRSEIQRFNVVNGRRGTFETAPLKGGSEICLRVDVWIWSQVDLNG